MLLLAVMAFLSMPTPMMRPTALVLNLLVASIITPHPISPNGNQDAAMIY